MTKSMTYNVQYKDKLNLAGQPVLCSSEVRLRQFSFTPFPRAVVSVVSKKAGQCRAACQCVCACV